MNTDGLDEIAESAREHFTAKHGAREKALPLCRETVRCSANAIRCVHRRDFAAAEELVARAAANLKEMDSALAQHPDILNAGYVHDAQKEYVEAATTLALIAGRPLPSPNDLGVLAAAYMNGIAETMDFPEAVTSGLRRSTDAMRGILERTRGDFTMAAVQRELEEKLKEFGKRLGY